MSAVLPDVPYQVSTTEKVLDLEEDLKRELAELKNEIEENEMVHGISRSISSVPLPKDPLYFRKQRECVIKRAMEVCEAKRLVLQSEVMQTELDNCQHTDYSADGLPLLLHQYFVDRIQQLVQCKHMHMLRWKRFCEHTSTIEALYPDYQARLSHIMSEYNDCLERAQRLAVSREAFLSGSNNSILAVQLDDVLIYLRWLVSHLHSVKTYHQFMRVLEWLPVSHREDLAPVTDDSDDMEELSPSARIPCKYQDDNFLAAQAKSVTSRPASAVSQKSGPIPPTPPPINPMLLSSNPVPAAQFLYAAASAGGGLASDENSLNLPLHTNDTETLKPQLNLLSHLYAIGMDIEKMSTPGEEMELYAAVNRKFRQVFNRQEHLKTFKTYDKIEVGQENWGADSSIHALKQECNWTSFVTLKAMRDPHLEKKMVELRCRNSVDELLRAQSRFLHVTDPEKVQDALRQHANAVREPIMPQPVSVTAHRTNYHTGAIWRRIYTNPELYAKNEDKLDVALQEFDDKTADNVNLDRRPKSQASRRRRDSYDYVNTVQLLGLDEGEQDSSEPGSVQGGYLSFLQLRHLRVRDLQRTCLSVLNYLRSVERTLTINDGGLSLESGRLKKNSGQNHRKTTGDGTAGGGGGLGSHHYVHYTPRDYKLEETEFMEFSEVENHDDFYTIDEGRVHVQDQRGYYVVYDSALNDLKSLEQDLLLIASHYLEKDKDLRNASAMHRSESARRKQMLQSTGDFHISSYSHQEVDRFGVLLDLWSHEAAFLECKKELLDCYMEAYQHVFDRDEKRSLAQVITNIMHQRPRYDFTAEYFVRGYRLECMCLRMKAQLVKSMLDKQMCEQREYVERVCRQGEPPQYGMPHRIIPKQPITVNMSRSALKNVYMLEFHPSLAVASRIPDALSHTYWELHHMFKPETTTDMILLEKRLLEVAIRELDTLEPIGSSYTLQAQRDLFSDAYVEDPMLLDELCRSLVDQVEQTATRRTQKEKQTSMLKTAGRVLECATLRHRLLDTAWECEVLSKIYRHQAVDLGYDDCHLFLRFVQFEFASLKEDAGRPPPTFITSVQEDDTGVDRYVPNHLYLAIHELDESHVGRFCFKSREGLLQVMKNDSMGNLQAILMCQVVHKNALICAVQQVASCQPAEVNEAIGTGRPVSPGDTKSEKSSVTAATASSGLQGGALSKLTPGGQRSKAKQSLPEAFVSIQLEKVPSRDLMLNDFINKKNQMGTVLRNPEKMEELKRKLIKEYCEVFYQRTAQYSLRAQIIAYYNSILGKLQEFPDIRDKFFMLGEPHERKSQSDDVKGLQPDPKCMKKRPRRVLSPDGKSVLNLWFIPHQSETLIMYKTLDDAACKAALTYHLRIVSALHDIIQYLCAHAKLGSGGARRRQTTAEHISADWGGAEGIGADLQEIQKQIDHLDTPTDPEQVPQFLFLRRDIMFLEFDAAVRHSMCDTFLATSNQPAYDAVTECMHFALHNLSNAQSSSFAGVYLNVPEPLEARDPQAIVMYPWRSFLNRHGPYPVNFWQWHLIEYNMQLCLAGIKDVDRHVANGEILGVSLLMEDVLLSGHQDKSIMTGGDGDEAEAEVASVTSLAKADKSVASSSSLGSTGDVRGRDKKASPQKNLSRIQQPLESYKLLRSFLLVWKRLEIMKQHWGRLRLGVEHINTPSLYRNFCKEYKKEKLYPILQSVARRYGQSTVYEGMVSENEALVIPKGASEMEIRTRQLVKLLESFECQMINDIRRKLTRELNLVLAERAREESALPTDLWKKPAMKEGFTINKPHIAESFIQRLMSEVKETDEVITMETKHLNTCLGQLASEVMAREKHNYESYSMYYENLLRVHHQLLYQREQEVKYLKDQLRMAQNGTMVEVQCQMADANQDLLLEITALRSKIAEMRQMSLTQEQDTRERVQEEYDGLVQNIFHCSFDLKKKFEEFKDDLHDDVYERINEARREGIEAMTKLKQRAGLEKDSEETQRNLAQAQQVRHIQRENHGLNVLVRKMRALSAWRGNQLGAKMVKKEAKLRQEADRNKKDYLSIKMYAEEETILLRQQMVALRNALRESEKECLEVKKELDKELKVKKEKAHASQQKAQSQRQLEEARRANIDQLLEELEDKDEKLRVLNDDQDKTRRLQQLTTEKAKKDVFQVKKQLNHERNLKLGAFQRVDDLQTQVYDIESGLYGSVRPQTAIGTMRVNRSRATSAVSRRPQTRGGTPTGGGVWPPQASWPANRCGTPGDLYENNPNNMVDHKKIQRPKTTQGRLRSRIAEQLLNELEAPDHHETLVKLQEMQLLKQKAC